METYDDDLSRFEADGAAPLPITNDQGYIERDGARIWYATYGSGPPVILLHGGLGQSGNWGYQVPALVRSGYRAVLIDSRGHGRSTRDTRPFTYELMAADVSAVMDGLHLEKAGLVGWSDGACIALILAMKAPTRVAGVFFFACNMDPSGAKQITELTPILARCLGRHAKDYARLSATPDQFKAFAEAVSLMMKTQPNYSARDLAQISVPVAIVHSEHDEFIKREHAEYLARSIPNAELVNLHGVSHFAPLQRPEQFNIAMLAFLGKALALRAMTICAGGLLVRGDQILLARRSADRAFYPGVWDVIGGHCEDEETPADALVRELEEEIGVTPRAFDEIAVLGDTQPLEHGEARCHMFMVTAWGGGEPRLRGAEHSDLRWLTLDQALVLPLAHPGYGELFRAALGRCGVLQRDATKPSSDWGLQ